MNLLKLDAKNLSGPQKAAVFLLAMGEEYSAQVFKVMEDNEIRKIATVMTQIEQIPPEVLGRVMEEFASIYQEDERLLVGGESFLKKVLKSTLDEKRAEAIIRDIESRNQEIPFDWSRNMNPATLGSYIQQEHPQTIAMILAHLPLEISSEILMTMPDDKKGDIAKRVGLLGQIPDEIIREVDEALRAELSDLGGRSRGKVGGIKFLVDILNNVDRATEEIVLETIEEEHAEMANEIRAMMFIFEDLVKVDDRAMREILKKVESQQLVLAMKTASEEMKQKILGNLSSRAAEMLTEDLEVMGPVRLSEVEEAQQEIVRIAKELEAEGTIVLGGKGKEDVLV